LSVVPLRCRGQITPKRILDLFCREKYLATRLLLGWGLPLDLAFADLRFLHPNLAEALGRDILGQRLRRIHQLLVQLRELASYIGHDKPSPCTFPQAARRCAPALR